MPQVVLPIACPGKQDLAEESQVASIMANGLQALRRDVDSGIGCQCVRAERCVEHLVMVSHGGGKRVNTGSLIEAVEHAFMDQASAFVNVTLRQFYVLSDQNAPILGRSDLQQCEELRSHMGLNRLGGQVLG